MIVYLAHWLAARGNAESGASGADGPVRFDRAAIRGPGRPRPDIGTTTVDRAHRPRRLLRRRANLFHLGLTLLAALGAASGLIMTIGSVPLQRVQTFMDPGPTPTGRVSRRSRGWRLSAPAAVRDWAWATSVFTCQTTSTIYLLARRAGTWDGGGASSSSRCSWLGLGSVRTALRAPDTFGA